MALLLVALSLALGGAACGGGDEDVSETTTEETTTDGTTTSDDEGTTTEAGRAVFVDNCATCHTLEDAGASGAVGPNLDEADLDVDYVEERVRNGGGGMPAFEDTLSDEQIGQVAGYVVAAQSD